MFFIVDILVNFNTAFMDDTGSIIRDHVGIARQYIRSVTMLMLLKSIVKSMGAAATATLPRARSWLPFGLFYTC